MKMFDVTVEGYGTAVMVAQSRGKALADAWRSPAFDCTFGDFLKIAKARVTTETPYPDGYDSVRRNYGVDPRIGQRVRILESELGEGVVVYPGPSTCYVHVAVGGHDRPICVHPSNVELLSSVSDPANQQGKP